MACQQILRSLQGKCIFVLVLVTLQLVLAIWSRNAAQQQFREIRTANKQGTRRPTRRNSKLHWAENMFDGENIEPEQNVEIVRKT